MQDEQIRELARELRRTRAHVRALNDAVRALLEAWITFGPDRARDDLRPFLEELRRRRTEDPEP